ncbi:ProQ/FinO family protein [Ensifer sp. ENS12]|nr:ProQ/FinO family protein [Ensifer sp. ENS12]
MHSRNYQIAVTRPGSVRHDINGEPVGPVSDADRLDAQQKYEGFRARGSRTLNTTSLLPARTAKTEATVLSSSGRRTRGDRQIPWLANSQLRGMETTAS